MGTYRRVDDIQNQNGSKPPSDSQDIIYLKNNITELESQLQESQLKSLQLEECLVEVTDMLFNSQNTVQETPSTNSKNTHSGEVW